MKTFLTTFILFISFSSFAGNIQIIYGKGHCPSSTTSNRCAKQEAIHNGKIECQNIGGVPRAQNYYECEVKTPYDFTFATCAVECEDASAL